MIEVKASGNFSKTTSRLERLKEIFRAGVFDKYGKMGVEALRKATPVDSGLTADSWRYKIETNATGTTIRWLNDNEVEGVNIAILIQYGHATKGGGYVPPNDFVNPAMKPIFDKIAKDAWEEVSKI